MRLNSTNYRVYADHIDREGADADEKEMDYVKHPFSVSIVCWDRVRPASHPFLVEMVRQYMTKCIIILLYDV